MSKKIARKYKGQEHDPIAQRTLDLQMNNLMRLNEQAKKKQAYQESTKLRGGGEIEESLLAAQRYQESRFNPNAVSPAGAVGVAQFMPHVWEGLQKQGVLESYHDPRNPSHAMQAQRYLMGTLMSRFNGDVEKALAAYNWGEGNLGKAITKHGDAWKEHLPKETSDYIQRVLDYQKKGVSDEGLYKPPKGELPLVKPEPGDSSESTQYQTPMKMKYGGFRDKMPGGGMLPLVSSLTSKPMLDQLGQYMVSDVIAQQDRNSQAALTRLGTNPNNVQVSNLSQALAPHIGQLGFRQSATVLNNLPPALNAYAQRTFPSSSGQYAPSLTSTTNSIPLRQSMTSQTNSISKDPLAPDYSTPPPVEADVADPVFMKSKQMASFVKGATGSENSPQGGIFAGLTKGDKFGIASQMPALGFSVIKGLQRPQKFAPILNANEGDIRRQQADRERLLRDNSASINRITRERRAAEGQIDNALSGPAREAFRANIFRQAATAKGEVEANTRRELADAKSRTISELDSLGRQTALARERARSLDIASQGNKDKQLANAASQSGNLLATIGKAYNQKERNEFFLRLAQTNDFFFNTKTGSWDYKRLTSKLEGDMGADGLRTYLGLPESSTQQEVEKALTQYFQTNS